MKRTAIATLVDGDALAAVKDLDGARRRSQIDLLADEAMRHGIEKGFVFDVIVRRDANQTPFREP